MSVIEQMLIDVPADLAETVRERAAEGGYGSASEVVVEALRAWEQAQHLDPDEDDLAYLREAVRIGDESGPGIPADEVFAELERIVAGLPDKA